MIKINCFKPYFNFTKPTGNFNDYFSCSLYICNQIQFSVSIMQYGFYCGVLFYDVLKGK